ATGLRKKRFAALAFDAREVACAFVEITRLHNAVSAGKRSCFLVAVGVSGSVGTRSRTSRRLQRHRIHTSQRVAGTSYRRRLGFFLRTGDIRSPKNAFNRLWPEARTTKRHSTDAQRSGFPASRYSRRGS